MGFWPDINSLNDQVDAWSKALGIKNFQGALKSDQDKNAFAHAYASAQLVYDGGEIYSTADLQISAIAILHGLDLATRDTRGFDHEGLKLINPWGES